VGYGLAKHTFHKWRPSATLDWQGLSDYWLDPQNTIRQAGYRDFSATNSLTVI